MGKGTTSFANITSTSIFNVTGKSESHSFWRLKNDSPNIRALCMALMHIVSTTTPVSTTSTTHGPTTPAAATARRRRRLRQGVG